MKAVITAIALLLAVVPSKAQQQKFLDNLRSYCGQSFEGWAVYPEENNTFAGQLLRVTFSVCDSGRVYMPFHVGTDKSRTWQMTMTDKGLLFKHDHRHEDGTPDDLTNYGGYADDRGNEWMQFFPADSFTAALLPEAATNEWTMVIDPSKQTLTYILKRHGELRFKAVLGLVED
jgi:hypothetical protein